MPASWARTDVPPSIASHVDDFDMNTPDTKVLIQQYLAQSRQSRFVALMSSDAASTSHGHHLPELDFSYSFSDPGHSSVARGSSSVPQSSSLSTRQPHNSIRALGKYAPQTQSAHTEAELEDAERVDGPPSELHLVPAAASSSFSSSSSSSSSSSPPPPVPTKRTASLPQHRALAKQRSISIVAPDVRAHTRASRREATEYSASEPGHDFTSSDTRYYHAPAPLAKPYSIRHTPPSSYPYSQLEATDSLENNMFRLRHRSSHVNETYPTNVFALSNDSAAQQQYYYQHQYRASAAFTTVSRTATRNKLRKAPPPSHSRSQSITEDGRIEDVLRPTRSVLAVDTSHMASSSQTSARRRADSEVGYLSEGERRMCVSESGHRMDGYPSFTSTATQSQLFPVTYAESPPQNAPSRHTTVSSSESSGSSRHYRPQDASPERGRRPRQPVFRSSSTMNTAASSSAHTSLSSGGSESTAPTSMSVHNMSSSDWAGKLANEEGTSHQVEEEKSVRRRSRSQSTPRKLVKKRYPTTPVKAHPPRFPLNSSPPPPVPPLLSSSAPNSPPPPRQEKKRSRSILSLRLAFTSKKEKKEASPEVGRERTQSMYEALPPVQLTQPLWVGSDHVIPNPYSSPSLYASPTSMSFSSLSSPPTSSPSHAHSLSEPSPRPFSLAPLSFPVSPVSPPVPEKPVPTRPTPRFRRVSTHALETLAMTDPHALSSTAVAELTSRLSMVEDQDQHMEDWERYRAASREGSAERTFNPYSTNAAGKLDADAKARPRPPKERRHLYRDSAVEETMRRWTLAMTDVPDEVLLDELERLRKGQTTEGQSSKPKVRSRKVKSVEGNDEAEDWSEFGMMGKHGKKKSVSVSGHEFVYGGPKKRKFNIGSVENADEEDDCSDCSGDSSSIADDDHYTPELSPIVASPSSDSDWTTARKALLCCRDIIRTERTYLSLLHQLLELVYPSSTALPSTLSTTLPTRTRNLIYTYLPDLIRASEAFLARLEDDPSAWGVSAALIGCEEEMEGAYVRWCGVVGDVFVAQPAPHPAEHVAVTARLSLDAVGLRSRVGSTVGFGSKGKSKSGVSISGDKGVQSVYADRPRAVSCYDGVISPSQASTFPEPPARPQSGLFTAALGTGLALGLAPTKQYAIFNQESNSHIQHQPSKNASGTLSRTISSWKKKGAALSQSASSLPVYAALHRDREKDKENRRPGGGKAKRVLSIRELAIQPTQRVTRYVLQYRDLLKYTPASSPSRALVERALESALKIAQRCDRAQGNSAFLRM